MCKSPFFFFFFYSDKHRSFASVPPSNSILQVVIISHHQSSQHATRITRPIQTCIWLKLNMTSVLQLGCCCPLIVARRWHSCLLPTFDESRCVAAIAIAVNQATVARYCSVSCRASKVVSPKRCSARHCTDSGLLSLHLPVSFTRLGKPRPRYTFAVPHLLNFDLEVQELHGLVARLWHFYALTAPCRLPHPGSLSRLYSLDANCGLAEKTTLTPLSRVHSLELHDLRRRPHLLLPPISLI